MRETACLAQLSALILSMVRSPCCVSLLLNESTVRINTYSHHTYTYMYRYILTCGHVLYKALSLQGSELQ